MALTTTICVAIFYFLNNIYSSFFGLKVRCYLLHECADCQVPDLRDMVGGWWGDGGGMAGGWWGDDGGGMLVILVLAMMTMLVMKVMMVMMWM